MHEILHESDPNTLLLQAVWGADTDGVLNCVHFIAEPSDKGWQHHPVKTVDEAASKAREIMNAERNAYFACSKYRTPDNRKGENVKSVRAFWLDIDCGEDKAAKGEGYATKQEAANALLGFCKAAGLPAPTYIADSGNGLHVYWVLDVAVSPEDWRAHSRLLKALTTKYGLLADPSRTTDIASVLRVPGTLNLKDPANPKPVKLKVRKDVVQWDKFKAALRAADGDDLTPNNSALTGGLVNDYPPMPETPENVERVRAMLKVIPADCPRADWRNVCWAVISTGWESAEQLARDWSASAPELFDKREFQKVVGSYKADGGVGFGTLVHIAREHGYNGTLVGSNGATDPVESALNSFNERHFVAKVGGGVYVFDEGDDAILAGGMTFTAFRQFHAGYAVNGVNIAAKWVGWKSRRTYSKLIFDPTGKNERDCFNTWQGFAVEPITGACERIIDHIREVWCGDNSAQFDYVIHWLAHLVQRPWEKPEVALVLRSREGSGKTIIVQILLKIFGVHGFTAAQKDQVAGRFNGHLFDKVLVVLEEAFFAGDPAAVSATKALITNQTLGYEAKGKDAFSAPNYAHVISLTNHDWAVPAGEDSRRWMALDVSDKRKGDHAYFEALAAEIRSGGTEALLHYLRSIDLSGWNPRALPDSRALRTQQMETLVRTDPVTAWVFHVLAEGAFTVEDGALEWRTEIHAGVLQESFHRATSRARNVPSWDAAAKKLRTLLPAGSLSKVRRSEPGGRAFYYVLPDLDDARAHFKSITGVDPCEA